MERQKNHLVNQLRPFYDRVCHLVTEMPVL